ncbi:acetate kinase [Azoarcus sp. DD4]|uniref:acetate kinase n=1 Tax=Azoarcus sp. DD4 TaxID=2027405 RepID=UPI00112C35F5|nr:acetate kinase [Azoarcus sp. DD4]QDF98438.1 acetate kinase [Azoarcus sp. DD4]
MKLTSTRTARTLGPGLGTCIMLAAAPGSALAEEAGDAPRMLHMQQQIEAQNRQIDSLKADLARQEAALDELRRTLGGMRGRGPATADSGAAPAQAPAAQTVARQGQAEPSAQQPVGQAPEPSRDTRQREVVTIFETPGVLTPPGKWIVEPSLQYAYSSSNRVALVGYTVIPAILIGLIDVREVKRNTFTAALTVRRGITNRFELEAKVPWVYRSDTSISREVFTGTADERVFDADGKGLGDVELTGRYQLNDGGGDSPYYIASLRFKTRTGKDPFEVETIFVPGAREGGLQTELPTGSGFYTFTPGLTVLIPSDPAVFFGGVSYQHSIKRSNVKAKTDGEDRFIGDVEPGGVIGFNFGMGLALNDRSSFSIGYDHQSVGKVKIDGRTAPGSVRVQLGTLLMGYSYRLNSGNSMNLSLGIGVTRDTPDLQLTLRMPISL